LPRRRNNCGRVQRINNSDGVFDGRAQVLRRSRGDRRKQDTLTDGDTRLWLDFGKGLPAATTTGPPPLGIVAWDISSSTYSKIDGFTQRRCSRDRGVTLRAALRRHNISHAHGDHVGHLGFRPRIPVHTGAGQNSSGGRRRDSYRLGPRSPDLPH
jgi:hypothetical protein